MGTFLTTSRMDPALAARIEKSVRGKEIETRGGKISPRVTALWRVFAVAAAILVVYVVTSTRRRDHQEFELAKTTFLATVKGQAALVTPEDRGSLVVMESWLARAAGPYEGDVMAPEVKGPGVLAQVLAQPATYVRGPLDAFTFTQRIRAQAAASTKDALLLCLVDPPRAADEKTLLGPVRLALTSALLLEQHTAHVRRLNDAVLGLPLLSPEFQTRIQGVSGGHDLGVLRREWNAAPADRTRQALASKLLVYVLDEPSNGGGPTELDGERPHDMRVGIVDLTTSKVLLRARQHVDPSWISPARKAEYATGLDGCQLASRLHADAASAGR
ncbi:MAG: hypothetical protein JWP97_341 [Labilithrix sp.]|nr:hypothetical protein [Labilithrix sp.]